MRSNKYFCYLLGIFLFSPTLASAGLIFDVSENDKSLQFINYFFGPLSGLGAGYHISVVAVLFNQFLYLFISIIMMVNAYNVFQGIVQGAGEGSFFGKNASSFLTPIKMVAGIGLLIPDTTGYATIQRIFIWVILNGVGLANQLWSTIELNAAMGNTLTVNKVSIPSEVSDLTASLLKIALAVNYMSTSSSYTMNSALNSNQIEYTFKLNQTNAPLAAIPIDPIRNPDLADRQLAVLFPIVLQMSQEEIIRYGATHSFQYSDTNFSTNYAQFIKSTYEDLVYRTLYEQELMTNQQEAYTDLTQNDEGWMSATSHYWGMYTGKQDNQANVSLICTENICDIGNSTNLSSYLFINDTMVSGLGGTIRSAASTYIDTLMDKGLSDSSDGGSGSSGTKNKNMIQKLIAAISYKDFSLDNFSANTLNQNISRPYLSDFVKKHTYIIQCTINFVQSILLSVISVFALSGALKGLSPFFYIMFQVVFGFIFLFLPIFLSLFSTASMGSIYVLLLPVIIFGAGVMGWFFKVIEAIFVAPFVAIVLMTPSEDELGRAMHSLTTLFTTALRPPLMIIGLVFATKLVHITLMLLGAVFYFFYESDFVQLDGGGFSEFFFNIMRYNTLTIISISLISRAFSFINLLPDLVFKMIGLDANEAQEADAFVEEMQSSCMKASENLGSFLGMFNQLSQTGVSNLASLKITG